MDTPPELVTIAPNPAHPLWCSLTKREREVALLIARGDKNREIAAALGASLKTIDVHRLHILKKMGLRSNVSLAHWCIRAGLVVLK